jgi:hypothetical protein
MAIISKKQKSLYWAALKYIILAFLVAIIGRLLISVSVFITIISFFIFFFLFNKSLNYLVGALGEYLVTKEIKKFGDDYFLINDVKLPEFDAQIDHILICPKGVFTIETKTWFGKVYGNGDEKYWRLYISKIPIKKYSPIKQGRRHSVKLSESLRQCGSNIYIKTIVVFVGTTKVKVRPQPIPVLRRQELYGYLSRQRDVLSREQVLRYKEEIMKVVQ